MKRILIATDGTERSLPAVEVGLQLAREELACAILVHVDPTQEHVATRIPVIHALTTELPAAHGGLAEAMTLADRYGVPCEVIHRAGDTATVIADVAEETDVDLIVVGTRGHSAVRSILGSVSEDVLRQTRRVVLVVPAEQAA